MDGILLFTAAIIDSSRKKTSDSYKSWIRVSEEARKHMSEAQRKYLQTPEGKKRVKLMILRLKEWRSRNSNRLKEGEINPKVLQADRGRTFLIQSFHP